MTRTNNTDRLTQETRIAASAGKPAPTSGPPEGRRSKTGHAGAARIGDIHTGGERSNSRQVNAHRLAICTTLNMLVQSKAEASTPKGKHLKPSASARKLTPPPGPLPVAPQETCRCNTKRRNLRLDKSASLRQPASQYHHLVLSTADSHKHNMLVQENTLVLI